MGKALSVHNLLNSKFKTYGFTGEFYDLMGDIETGANIMVYGNSANGKTSFLMQFAKYLSQFERVAFNSLEEGIKQSLQSAVKRAHLTERHKILFIDREPMDEFSARLKKHKAPKIAIVDSIQYTGFKVKDYDEFKNEHFKKTLIWNSHSQGNEPKGALGKHLEYDCDVKIRVEGFKAFANSRYGGTTNEYTIWQEQADKYWLNK